MTSPEAFVATGGRHPVFHGGRGAWGNPVAAVAQATHHWISLTARQIARVVRASATDANNRAEDQRKDRDVCASHGPILPPKKPRANANLEERLRFGLD